jgi:hypothetical protein
MSCQPNDFMCIVNNCSGGIGSGTELFNYWQDHNCPAAYAEAINTAPDGSLAYNPDEQLAMQMKVVELFNTYFLTNSLTDDVTSTSFNTFQNTLLSLCINPTLPGICELFLGGGTGVSGYCEQFSRAQAINSPTLINFCGCYVPPNQEYLQFTLGSSGCQIGTGCTAGCTAGNTGCTGQPACDPLCHRAMTSQKVYQPTGNFITCPQNICVIDNVTISATESEVPGGINFNTVCSGCGGASGGDGCLCIVSGLNVSATMSQIGVGTNFNEFCGASSVCIVQDAAGNIISESGCTGINPTNIGISSYSYLPNLGILFIIILVVLLIFFIAITARFATQKVNRPTILEEQAPKEQSIQFSYQIK